MASIDRDVLVALYHATGGPNWNTSSNWNTGAYISRWHGVKINDQGRVIMIDLTYNNLRGSIPKELGALSELKGLGLEGNQLSGSIPPQLGHLSALKILDLSKNKLTGEIPSSLTQLGSLRVLHINDNKLSGSVPPELGRLAGLQWLYLNNNFLSGGPAESESLRQWRTRLEAEAVEKERTEKSWADENSRLEVLGTNSSPTGRTSSPGGGRSDHVLQQQVASFSELGLIRDDPESLEEVKRLLGNPAARNVPSGSELTHTDKLQELDRLVAMAKALTETASRYTDNEEIRLKEKNLDPGPKVYYTAIRSGLCNAYLAASVVGSGLVSTSNTGVMGKVGSTLKLMSGAVPLVSGLAGLAGAALKAGDCHVQTRLVVKIIDFAPDAAECSQMARTLALRLADGLTDSKIAKSYDAEESHTHSEAQASWGPGGSTSSEGSGALPDGVSEGAVMEWFIEKIANYEPSNGATTGIREAGRRLGTRHLHKLLTAMGRDCLQGANDAEEKVNRLVSTVHPEANIWPAESSSASYGDFARSPSSAPTYGNVVRSPMSAPRSGDAVRSPISAPTHDGNLQQILAELEALKADYEKHRVELEALKADNKVLQGKVATLEDRLPESQPAPVGSVDAGERQLLTQEQETQTKEEMEDPADGTDGESATADELRVIQDHAEEIRTETDDLDARVAAEEGNRGKKGFLSCFGGHR